MIARPSVGSPGAFIACQSTRLCAAASGRDAVDRVSAAQLPQDSDRQIFRIHSPVAASRAGLSSASDETRCAIEVERQIGFRVPRAHLRQPRATSTAAWGTEMMSRVMRVILEWFDGRLARLLPRLNLTDLAGGHRRSRQRSHHAQARITPRSSACRSSSRGLAIRAGADPAC